MTIPIQPHTEIERKFFMKPEFRYFAMKHNIGLETLISQGYLSIVDEIEVRVRASRDKLTGKGEITIKNGKGIMRQERTMEIDIFTADALIDGCGKWQIDKTRYRIFDRWEIDVYYGRHPGLVIAEIELTSPDEQIEMPEEFKSYLIREVTEEAAFKNRNLAVVVKTPK